MTLFDLQTPAALAAAGAPSDPAGADNFIANGEHAGEAAGGSTTHPAGPVLTVHVVGLPAPQGSKRGFVVGNRAVVVDDNKPTLRTWRDDVKRAALDEITATGYTPADDGLVVDVTFLLPRPRSHYRTGRNAHLLRDSAPAYPTTKPDIDKLLRSTLDALKVAGAYRDDSHVVRVVMEKLYAVELTGAAITIYRATGSRHDRSFF